MIGLYRRPSLKMRFLLLMMFLPSITCCSLIRKKGQWGKNAFWPIKASRITKSFKDNASSVHVWAPLIAAGAIHVGGYDPKISKWAVKERPVYTTQKNTSYWSDQNNNILLYEMYLSILLTPSMDEDESLAKYAWSKTKGGLVVNLSSRSTRFSRNQLAKTFRRQRPNHVDRLSFPSGHATEASSRNSLVSKNLDAMDIDSNLRNGIKTINTTLAAGTLWARLEGQRHYPSDVLVGYALGSFLAGFVYDSLMNLEPYETFAIVPYGDQISARYAIQF